MAGKLMGKVAVVIGAGSIGTGWGNGKATAVLFAREGANVFCVDIDEKSAQETVAIIRNEGGNAVAKKADASSASELKSAINQCLDTYGRVDILNNNVGVVEVGGVVELSEEKWDRIFNINLKSCFLAMKYVIPLMQKQGGGAIVNISSIASIRYMGIAYASYYATKAAMNHLTRTTAVEYAADKIRVNAILPGLMKTPMVEKSTSLAENYSDGDVEEMWKARDAQIPIGYMGDAWDVANAALFLVSNEAKYITGIELVVDGGMTLKVS